MIAVLVRAKARTREGADELARLWHAEIQPLMRTHSGFAGSHLLKDGLSFQHLAFWLSRADYERFMESIDRASMLEAAKLTDDPEIGAQEAYEVVGD